MVIRLLVLDFPKFISLKESQKENINDISTTFSKLKFCKSILFNKPQ